MSEADPYPILWVYGVCILKGPKLLLINPLQGSIFLG